MKVGKITIEELDRLECIEEIILSVDDHGEILSKFIYKINDIFWCVEKSIHPHYGRTYAGVPYEVKPVEVKKTEYIPVV